MQKVDIVIIALSSPILIGIYKDDKLIEKIESKDRVSDILDSIFIELFEKYDINSIFFAKGPGSFMAIKLVYVFLKSLKIVKNIDIFATDGFYFSKNEPIRAIGNSSFVKKSSGKIEIEKIITKENKFYLPTILDKTEFSSNIEPLYILPAV